MKLFKGIKFTALIAIVLSLAVGCASTPEGDDPVAMAQAAIADAKAANEEAKAAGAEWQDTEAMIQEAEAALEAGDTGKAIQLAEEARRQAEDRLAQLQGGMSQYTVVQGDSLWAISGRSEIYGNPYQWPLIYKANRDKIKDADLIYPGQEFDIEQSPSMGDVDAAVSHAKSRGAWSLGVTEDSDMSYLNQ